jgi:hypothetical protein
VECSFDSILGFISSCWLYFGPEHFDYHDQRIQKRPRIDDN